MNRSVLAGTARSTWLFAILSLLALVSAAGLLAVAGLPGVPAGSWQSAGAMGASRTGACAVLLGDGRVLVAGGDDGTGPVSSTELYDGSGAFVAAAAMSMARSNQACAALGDGRVLVTGGFGTTGAALSSAEIYDPFTDSWSIVAGGLLEPRADHSATFLSGGGVLLSGGTDGATVSDTMETFDPTTGAFTAEPARLSSPRRSHGAEALADGRVLILGGSDGSRALDTADLFDPADHSISAAPALGTPREGHTVTRLLDGRILVAGGNDGTHDLSSAELYDAGAGAVVVSSSALATPRHGHLAFRLQHNNEVLIVGGVSNGAGLASAELYSPWDDAFTATGSMQAPRAGAIGSALSQDGVMVVMGGTGSPSAEQYGFATLRTDKSDYAPEATVTVTGEGWRPNETVSLVFQEEPMICADRVLTVTADADGRLYDTQFAPEYHDIGVRFYLTAVGAASEAQITFTDAAATRIKVNSISPTTGACGSTIAATATLEVKSGPGTFVPLAGETVIFTLGSSTGSGVTDAAGVATASLTVPTGATTLVASYAGSSSYNAVSTSTGFTVTGVCCTAPAISTQPSSRTAVIGEPVSFSIVATGQAPLSYQWRRNGSDLAGATLDTLSLGGVAFADAGSYDVVVTNSCGTATSNAAILSVGQAGSATSVVASQNPSFYGAGVSFTATVAVVAPGAGLPTGTVQFKVDGADLGTPVPLSSGSATSPATASLAAGAHTISADYSGDAQFQSGTGTMGSSQAVTPAPLTVTAADATRGYGAANPSLGASITGIQNGDNITATCDTTATPASAVGSYPIVPTLVDPDGKLGNYTVTPVDGTLTVTAATLGVTAADATRGYGAANPAMGASITGIQNGDNITATCDTTATPASAVGSYPIVPTLVDPDGKLGNYTVTPVDGTLTVTAAALGVTAADATRGYGAANPAMGASITGIQNGDNITATYATAATLASAVGSYPIVPTLVDPDGKLGNYTVTPVDGTLTVTAAALGVTAADATRGYGAANPSLGGSITGIQNGDDITATYATAATLASAVGSYPIVPTLVDPDGKLGNYTVTPVDGTLTVTAAALTATGASLSRAYGAANPTLGGSITGIQNGDDITATYATAATLASPVGSYPIVPTLVDPDGKLGNYAVTIVDGTLAVTAGASLTVSANAATRVYGAANPSLGGTVAGIQNGDDITATYATAATPASAVGSYPIVPTLVDPDGKLSNYTVTIVDGSLGVTQAPLSVAAADASRVYGFANPSFGGALTGVQNGDNISVVYLSPATPASAVGPYPIVPALVDPDGKLGNYAVTYTNGALMVGQAALAVTADDATRAFGLPNPSFTGTVSGLQNGDDITATYASGATISSPAGTYSIVPTLADPDGKLPNYAVTMNDGTLTVTLTGLTITSPLSGDTLDCRAAPPTITWNAAAYDKFKVFVSWSPTFSKRISSGDTWLKTPTWGIPAGKWANVCAHGSPTVYLKVLGVDVNVPKKDPSRRTFSNTVTDTLQH